MMGQPTLFELPPEREPRPEVPLAGKPRLRMAQRDQVIVRTLAVDQMLPHDDEARTVWEFVCQCDLSPLLNEIRAVEGNAGYPPADPRILLALWLLATLRGVGSARELARLCERHLAYQWLCGEVTMNHHTLSDFRVQHAAVIDGLLTQSIAVLMQAGAVKLQRVAQDGVRTRASAGKSSFRRRETLERFLAEAREQVQTLKRQVEEDPTAAHRREIAAKQRAADDRLQRVQQALVACAEVQAMKEKRGGDSLKNPARASTTDPDARNMKMADGGFRPAYNVQFATDTQSQVIVGVEVIKQGSDAGQLTPMVEQIEQRTGVRPKEMLADGGYCSNADIEALNDPEQGYKVYTPVKADAKQLARGEDPFAPRRSESPELTEWRTRMGTDEAKTIYKERASTAECVNALARQRGLQQFSVQGQPKVRTVVVWFALAHNVRRWAVLRADLAVTVRYS
jgi:transposase